MSNLRAFTLVELIVVITILAILSTISFITLSGYSKEARDSKRITDTSSILSKINIEFVKGEKLSNLIIKDKDNNLTIKSSSNPGFQGIPNYEVLKEDYKNFRDPTNNQIYPFAYTIGGTGSGAYTFMQMATVSESEGRARLMGNYFKFDDNDSPSLFTSSGTTGINIPADYLEDNGIDLPYNIGMQVAPLVCNTGYHEVNNRCVAIVCGIGKYLDGNDCKDIICPTGKYLDGNDCKDIICETGEYLDGNDCKDIVCETGKYLDGNDCKDIICKTGEYLDGNDCKNIICENGKYLDGNDCIAQWSGDVNNGYIFKNLSGSITYPTSCNNLLTDNQFKVGTIAPYNGSKFIDGIYYIKPNYETTAFKVLCDMTTDGGGWTNINYNFGSIVALTANNGVSTTGTSNVKINGPLKSLAADGSCSGPTPIVTYFTTSLRSNFVFNQVLYNVQSYGINSGDGLPCGGVLSGSNYTNLKKYNTFHDYSLSSCSWDNLCSGGKCTGPYFGGYSTKYTDLIFSITLLGGTHAAGLSPTCGYGTAYLKINSLMVR